MTASPQQHELAPVSVEEFHETFHRVCRGISRVVVGQEQAIEHLLAAVFAGGHVLLTGMPGLGRTLLVKTLGETLGLEYRRLQFTPDLLPTDIVGTELLEHDHETGQRRFRFFRGPVFTNLLLVDEINRSPTRTQAALLEVMQERQVTAGGQTMFLPRPFLLVATENSLDSEGVWRLGEAQVDRFMMCIKQHYPEGDQERRILQLTTGTVNTTAERVASPEKVLAMQALVRLVPVVPSAKDFALAIVRGSRPGQAGSDASLNEQIVLGPSPRATQALLLGAKVIALARGRTHVSMQDVAEVARPVLAHRLLMDVRAETEGHTCEELIERLIQQARRAVLPEASRWTRGALKTVS